MATTVLAAGTGSMQLETPTTHLGGIQAGFSAGKGGNTTYRGIVEWDLTAYVGRGVTVASTAKIRLYCLSANTSTSPTIYGYRMTRAQDQGSNAWVYTQNTWNVYKTSNNWSTAGGDYTSTPTETSRAWTNTAGVYYEWTTNVAALVQDAIDTRGGYLAMEFKLLSESSPVADTVTYDSSTGGNPPEVVFEWAMSPTLWKKHTYTPEPEWIPARYRPQVEILTQPVVATSPLPVYFLNKHPLAPPDAVFSPRQNRPVVQYLVAPVVVASSRRRQGQII